MGTTFKVEWPYASCWMKRSFDTNTEYDKATFQSVMNEVLYLSTLYDVIIDNGVITFVEKS
jgi:hypothetical protein